MSKTPANLEEAYAGESKANHMYLSFAAQAEKEGSPQIARLFRAIAAAELVHARNHFRAQGKVRSTEENLRTSISAENYEIVSMYPQFMAEADEESEKKASTSFRWAWEVEKEHEVLLKQALETMGGSIGDLDIWVCPVCGHTHIGVREDHCPVCNTPGERFDKM